MKTLVITHKYGKFGILPHGREKLKHDKIAFFKLIISKFATFVIQKVFDAPKSMFNKRFGSFIFASGLMSGKHPEQEIAINSFVTEQFCLSNPSFIFLTETTRYSYQSIRFREFF